MNNVYVFIPREGCVDPAKCQAAGCCLDTLCYMGHRRKPLIRDRNEEMGRKRRSDMAKKDKESLPAFVVDGEYEDHEWREIAASPEGKRTTAQARRFKEGPRLHPYGPNAYRDEADDGSVRWFADRDARNAYVNTNEADTEARRMRASPTEGGPEQDRATRKGLESAERVQRHGEAGGGGGNRGRSGR
jgi:hypothetical protein